jgi:hypothetical protein
VTSFFTARRVERIDLVEATITGLSTGRRHRLRARRARCDSCDRILVGRIDEVEQHLAALDMAEEAVADAGAVGRAFDQAGDVGDDEFMRLWRLTTPSCGRTVVKA